MVPCVQEIESNGKLYVGIGKVVPAGGAGKDGLTPEKFLIATRLILPGEEILYNYAS